MSLDHAIERLRNALQMHNENRTTMQSLASSVGDFLRDAATLRQQAGRVDEGLVDELRAEAKLHYGSNTANDTADLLIRAAAALAQNTQGDGELCDAALTAYHAAWEATGTPWPGMEPSNYIAHQRAVVAVANLCHAERARVPANFGERIKLAIEHGDAHGWQTARNELLGVLGSDYFAEGARVPEGMVLVPQQFVDKVRAASQPFTHPRAVPVLIEEAMDALEPAAPSQRAEVK